MQRHLIDRQVEVISHVPAPVLHIVDFQHMCGGQGEGSNLGSVNFMGFEFLKTMVSRPQLSKQRASGQKLGLRKRRCMDRVGVLKI